LPFDLQIIKFKSFISISDKNGYPILQEKFQKNWSKDSSTILKLLKYSKNEIGFVVMVLTSKNEIQYVFINPKQNQNYSELQVDYTVFNEDEYLKLNINDNWKIISPN
jgi:hypothetical protein